jgi:hypothetical protein
MTLEPQEKRLAPVLRRASLVLSLCLLAAFTVILPARAEDWLPVTQEELKMTREPKAPGAPAIYLYRQVDRDDNGPHERNYARIKILTEEGRKYADVEIPFLKGAENVRDIEARTIRPDGSIRNLEGKIYEKMIVKAKGVKYLAKTFTLPDVQVGSIVEYRYRADQQSGFIFNSHWILSEELFTKHAKFSLKPSLEFPLRFSWPAGLPVGTNPPITDHGVVRLETNDVPAFQVEDYMPPEYGLKTRVDFIYVTYPNPEKDLDKFWKEEGRRWYRWIEAFVDERKTMGQAVSQIVQSNDAPEAKLRKIYARTQEVRNLSIEREKSEKEDRRENLKGARTVDDVWKHGYGTDMQITWLFLALARAAGFQADPVMVSTRNLYFFSPGLRDPNELNSNVILVKLDDKDLYLDPGSAFTPFGLLPWSETRVQGLRIDKEGGSWITTASPGPSESRIERKAILQLTDSGSLEGKATITFTGLEALWRRSEAHDADDAERKKFLEDQIKEYIPVPAEAELTNKPDWNSSSLMLVAEFDLKVPDWASAAGRRTLLPVGLFGGLEKHTFEHSDRVYPIYFHFPYQDDDDVTIGLPSGWQVSNLPKVQNINLRTLAYNLTTENNNGSLHVKRQFLLNVEMVDPKSYPLMRGFFQGVRTGDEQQIIVAGTSSAQN